MTSIATALGMTLEGAPGGGTADEVSAVLHVKGAATAGYGAGVAPLDFKRARRARGGPSTTGWRRRRAARSWTHDARLLRPRAGVPPPRPDDARPGLVGRAVTYAIRDRTRTFMLDPDADPSVRTQNLVREYPIGRGSAGFDAIERERYRQDFESAVSASGPPTCMKDVRLEAEALYLSLSPEPFRSSVADRWYRNTLDRHDFLYGGRPGRIGPKDRWLPFERNVAIQLRSRLDVTQLGITLDRLNNLVPPSANL